MPFIVTDRVTVVTGASHGVGQATALILTAAGTDLVLIGHDVTALTHVAQDVQATGRAALVMLCDITMPNAAAWVIAATLERFGRLDTWSTTRESIASAPLSTSTTKAGRPPCQQT